ncbi:HTH-type transcriptional repressor of iron proteins A [Pseudovibrio sp. W64]|uniref:AraC family transcriptional regulator n=1 Tax=unclassified Pseudovibrio TaxID=2627060 RepID=UPI0007AE77AE|nr:MULTISPECIES: helix-turn-helix transcriptional regulator [unclassified Pseudovibrio]KZK83784.1 HTH-type transcriptional repressor of iron proteins A [Pseudovibrio sp. W64]KZK93207.1 HTH-type transcriptional repressor of iron proteins A [Pseudovibrio sp. W74]KZL07098.1 HTH-type transcriptional repressor of iron proteins A [Pseudovibrio sp. Ad14]
MPIHADVFADPHEVDRPQPIVAYAVDMPIGGQGEPHAHSRGQLVHIMQGSTTVFTEEGTFVVPPERAVWVPGGMVHRTVYPIKTQFRSLYLREDWSERLSDKPVVVQVTPLLRELIQEIMAAPRDYALDGATARIAQVIVDQLKSLPDAPLQLPMPVNHVLLKELCQSILSCPAHLPSLADAAERTLMSQRTFERRFFDETGWSYRKWCGQAKLFRALELLSAGRSVGDVAFKLGYEGPSPFISQFRKAFGTTPGKYFKTA